MSWGFVLLAVLLTVDAGRGDQPPADVCASLSGKTIRWVVPSKPGGGYDAYSRLIQPFLEQHLDVRIRMENRSEAGGIVAALSVRDAEADGTTMGIINAPGLLTASIVGNGRAPDPGRDFTVLGRVMDIQYVVYTGRTSGISSIAELLDIARNRPILIGVRDSGSSSFFAVPVMASLLGMDHALVTGYVGTAARTLAAIRGEVDIVVLNYDSSRRYLNSGELIPLLQVTGVPVNHHGILPGLSDLARLRAESTGRTPEQAELESDALNRVISAGRIVVAPHGLPEPLAACLGDVLMDVLQSHGFRMAARRAELSIAPLDRASARRSIETAAREIVRFDPLLRAALEQVRQ